MSIPSLQISFQEFKEYYTSFQGTIVSQQSAHQKITTIEKMGIPLGQKIAILRHTIATLCEREEDQSPLIGYSQELEEFQRLIQTNIKVVTRNLLSGNEDEKDRLLQRIKAATPECLNQCSDQERQNITHVFEALKKYSEFNSALSIFEGSLEKNNCNMLIEKLEKSLGTFVAFRDFIEEHQSILTTNVLQNNDLKAKLVLSHSKGNYIIRLLSKCLSKLQDEDAPLEDKIRQSFAFARVIDQTLKIFPEKADKINSVYTDLITYQKQFLNPIAYMST